MKQTVTAKIRLYPAKEQVPILDDMISAYQNSANYISKEVFPLVSLRNDGTIAKLPAQAKVHDMCYSLIREKFGLKSQQACSVRKAVLASYLSIQENKHELDAPVCYRHIKPTLQRGKDYTVFDDYISITTLEKKRSKIRYFLPDFFKAYLACGKLGTAQLIRKHGKFHLHVSVTIEVEDVEQYLNEDSAFVGVDRGIRFAMATYDSNGKTKFFSGKEVKEKRKQYKAKRKELQKKGTSSARRRLKAMGSRENRWMNDVNHRLSKALVKQYPKGTVFVLEDLSGIRKALVKVRRKDRYEQVSWSYGDLANKIAYKAALAGQKVVFVDPAHSSQECPICGHISKKNRDKTTHEFSCEECGYRSNDDRSAAMVLMGRGRNEVLAESDGVGSSPGQGLSQ